MYAKLIWRSARRSAQDYLVYIVTLTLCVMLFYAFLSISSRYYRLDIGIQYDFTLLSDGMRAAVFSVALVLLFLIRVVNRYMLRRRQKEFAVQSLMGMEQGTVAWLFFAETLLIGGLSVLLGIGLGALCSQCITAMLCTDYGLPYRPRWSLFPDTALWTAGYFAFCLCVVGLSNVRTIRRTRIIEMLAADRQNDPALPKSRWMQAVTALYLLLAAWMALTGGTKLYFYCDSRMPLAVQGMFWGNLLGPAALLGWAALWLVRYRRRGFRLLLGGLLAGAAPCAVLAACMPGFQRRYSLAVGAGTINQYLLFILADLLFLICGTIYLASSLLAAWKERSPAHHYGGSNLFFLGQITSKLTTTSKSMALVCITLTAAILLFLIAPVLTGWSEGYLAIRSLYDVQISSRYNNVYDEADLPGGDYALAGDFLTAQGIPAEQDLTFSLYLPRRADFHQRNKFAFPAVGIRLSDYNALRRMLGYPAIQLAEGEFATQWQTVATRQEREDYLRAHTQLETDAGTLTLAEQAAYTEPMGETVYNSYTDLLYILPDSVCSELLPVMRNRYIRTACGIPFEAALELERQFTAVWPEEAETGPTYMIRLRTLQVNSSRAMNFILKAAMLYGAVVLLVICLTILSLQQLLDAGQYRYRFAVLRKLGVEAGEVRRLVLRQLGVWFGLPVTVAAAASAVVMGYFLQTISAEIAAYIGSGVLAAQTAITVTVLALLLGCYFISTYLLFQRCIEE